MSNSKASYFNRLFDDKYRLRDLKMNVQRLYQIKLLDFMTGFLLFACFWCAYLYGQNSEIIEFKVEGKNPC